MAVISNGTTIFDAGSMASGFGSAMVLIKKLTASSSSDLQFIHGSSGVVFDSTYKEYIFVYNSIHPQTNAVDFTFQASTDGGSSYGITTTHTNFNAYHSESGAAAFNYEAGSDRASGTGEIELVRETKLSSDSDHCGHGVLHIFDPANTTFAKHYSARTQTNHEAEYTMDSYINGYLNTTTAINAIRFKTSSGNIDSGTITLYGIS